MSGLAQRYHAVIAPARGPVLGYLFNGVSVSLKPLAAVFLLREAGRAYNLVGLVLAAEVVGAALGMLLQGRLIDRHGPLRVLLPLVAAHFAFLVTFVVAVDQAWSIAAIVAITFLWGFTQPVLLPSLRALWGTLFSDEQRETAFAVQAVLTEIVFVLGPLLASGVALLVSPAAAMMLAALLSLLGVATFVMTVRQRPVSELDQAAAQARGALGPLKIGQMRALIMVAALSGVTGGAVEILLPVFAESSGDTERAGIGFALMALGSIVGGLVYGARSWAGTLGGRLALFTAIVGVALLPLILEPAFVAVCVVLFVAGIAIAPSEACLYALIDDVADDATIVEANSWVTALYTVGLGVGAAAGGQFVDARSVPVAAVIPAAAALVAALVVLIGVRRIARPDEPHEPASPLAAT